MNHFTHIIGEYLFGQTVELIAFIVRWRYAIEGWKAGVENEANL